MLVGAGTVTTSEQLDCALAAGAKFIVSPGFNPDMVKYGLSKGALMLPGTATGGEMEQAMSMGLDAVKFFPAEQNGGIAKLKAQDTHERIERRYEKSALNTYGTGTHCHLHAFRSFRRARADDRKSYRS